MYGATRHAFTGEPLAEPHLSLRVNAAPLCVKCLRARAPSGVACVTFNGGGGTRGPIQFIHFFCYLSS